MIKESTLRGEMDVKMAFKVHEVLFDEINDAKDFKLTRKMRAIWHFLYYLLFHLVPNTINQIEYMYTYISRREESKASSASENDFFQPFSHLKRLSKYSDIENNDP